MIPEEELEEVLKNHDWEYRWGDQHRFLKGERERVKIRELTGLVNKDVAEELYKKYMVKQ